MKNKFITVFTIIITTLLVVACSSVNKQNEASLPQDTLQVEEQDAVQIEEQDIASIQLLMDEGRLTSKELTE